MLPHKIIAQDKVGHHYQLHLRHEPPVRAFIKPERFSDEYFTWLFVTKLNVADWRWVKILHQVSESPPNRRLTTYQCQQAIAALILRGVIKVYRLKHFKRQEQQTRYPIISTSSNEHCHFIPIAELLAHDFREVRLFQDDQKRAHDFIKQLALTDKQLTAITHIFPSSFKALPAPPTTSRGKQLAKLKQALVEGKLAVTVERVNMTRPEQTTPELFPEEAIGHQSVSLGPHEERSYNQEQVENAQSPNKAPKFTNLQPMDQEYLGEETGVVWGSKVVYLDDKERQKYQIHIKDGKLFEANGNLFDTSDAESIFIGGGGSAIFVMDEYGSIYASKIHHRGKFHHSSFLAGQPVASAGEVVVENGVVKELTRRSGHYQPTLEQSKQFLKKLNNHGVDVDRIDISGGF